MSWIVAHGWGFGGVVALAGWNSQADIEFGDVTVVATIEDEVTITPGEDED